MYYHKIFLVVFFSATVFIANSQTQNKFLSEKGKCSIEFPAQFLTVENFELNIPYAKVTANFAQEKYYFKFKIFNEAGKITDNSVNTKSTAQSFLIATKGTLVESKVIRLKNYSGYEYVIQPENSNSYIFYRTFIINNIQYQFFVNSNSTQLSKEGKLFLNSFEIIE